MKPPYELMCDQNVEVSELLNKIRVGVGDIGIWALLIDDSDGLFRCSGINTTTQRWERLPVLDFMNTEDGFIAYCYDLDALINLALWANSKFSIFHDGEKIIGAD